MKRLKIALAILLPACGLIGWRASSKPAGGRVLVLEDFEGTAAAKRWQGPLEIANDHVSHGQHSARIRLDRTHPQISSAKLAANWAGYDRLLFDLYSDRDGVSTGTLRIYDAVGGDVDKAPP